MTDTTPVAVGIDIGGTKMLAGAVTADGRILARERRVSPVGDVVGILDAIAELAGALGPGLPVGIGVAGMVSADGELIYAPNLRLRSVPLARPLTDRLQVPVTAGNDGNVAVFAEARAGAAHGASDAVMFTLGTGVGGGLVIGGRMVNGARGYAGEAGHLIVQDGGRACGCGNHGCVEAYASGTAMGVRATQRLAAGEASLLPTDRSVTAAEVAKAAHAGDALAQDVFAEAGTWLGIAIASVANLLDPEVVVIGGGAASGNEAWLLPAARIAVAERLLGAPHREPPPIVGAQFGDDAGVIGAALLACEVAR